MPTKTKGSSRRKKATKRSKTKKAKVIRRTSGRVRGVRGAGRGTRVLRATATSYRAVCSEGDYSGPKRQTSEDAQLDKQGHLSSPGKERHRVRVIASTDV